MIILYLYCLVVKTILSRIWTCTQVQYCVIVQGFLERRDEVNQGGH
jgi:hypothetical protein